MDGDVRPAMLTTSEACARLASEARIADMIKGVMFDFSGTLFRIESTADWLRAAATEAGHDIADDELAACANRLEVAGAQPGGRPPQHLPSHLDVLWRERDLSAEQHRAAYTALARHASLPSPDMAEALYDRHHTSAAWQPYGDTEATLGELRRKRIPVAVVSNIGWDLRPVFRDHRVDHLIDAYVLSFERGIQKPDPALFQAACDQLGLPPSDVLMVGDDHRADGGATALGCKFHLVDHLPVDQRPSALTAVLELL